MLQKDKETLSDFTKACTHEWIETNGLGGWASSSIIGCNTRRYHGLLVAAVDPPAGRMALVSRLDETVVIDDRRYELGTNQYPDNIIHPQGYKFLTRFTRELFPTWTYEIEGLILKKTIGMVYCENTTAIIYEVMKAPKPFMLELQPFASVRSYHSLMHANNSINSDAHFDAGLLRIKAYDGTPEIYINIPGSQFLHEPAWFYRFNYSGEKYRGLDFEEDLFTHGRFTLPLTGGQKAGIILSTENPQGKDPEQLLAYELIRKQSLLKGQPADETFRQLLVAADQFIVERKLTSGVNNGKGATIIAGYHWFTDWGRDTMISLPGLCLSTGRYHDAKNIIRVFAESVTMGMLPNRFHDNNEPPEYNNVDGTLWYFIAIYKYLRATNDSKFILQKILPVLKEIIDWHFRGTRYNIHVDADGLLYAGEEGQQLTWMDARIGNWVVTPRMGKPVEIQALWYNTLKIFAELLALNGKTGDAAFVDSSADKAKQSFIEKFWYAGGGYLYDVIDEHGEPDSSLRPNQLFAISLPFALLDGDKANSVAAKVQEKLYVSPGLRSLSPDDERYVPVYGGDAFKRDSGYHQGTVWSWLLGPFVDVIIKVEGRRDKAVKIITEFAKHLNEGGIGTVSEIMDAEPPHHPRGCIAQAWGVAEILRVMHEHNLTSEKSRP